MKPFVGLPDTDEQGRCAYAPDLDRPSCDELAAVHLALRADGWGVVGLLTCAGHEMIARETGVVLAEHPTRDECRFSTGECWS